MLEDDETEDTPRTLPIWVGHLGAGVLGTAALVVLLVMLVLIGMGGVGTGILMFIIGALQLGALILGGIKAAQTRTWGSFILTLMIVAGIFLLLYGMCVGVLPLIIP